MQEKTLWRGILCSPFSSDRSLFYRDGALVTNGNRIEAVGPWDLLAPKYPHASRFESSGTPWMLIPGFVDLHLHWVQNRVKGSFQESLLPWLKNHIWPEEARFADPRFAEEMIHPFYAELASHGTVAAMIYSSVHPHACRLALEHAYGDMIVGNVVMTQNSPPELLTDEEEAIRDAFALGDEFGSRYAVTPRFAPTCGESCLERLSDVADKHGTWIQTHLSENTDEISWVKDLFPRAAHYTDVYDRAGLLSDRTILGHCIHLSDNEWRLMQARKANVAHCPTSNRALGSGRMPLEKLREYGIPFALGSDIGGGPTLSMFSVMRAFLEDHAPFTPVTAVEALYRATLAGAEILELDRRLGSLTPGKDASFVVLAGNWPVRATAEEQLRELLSENDNPVVRTVVKGQTVYAG